MEKMEQNETKEEEKKAGLTVVMPNGEICSFTYTKSDLGVYRIGKRLLSYMGTDASRLNISSAALAVVAGPLAFYFVKFDAVHSAPNHTAADIAAKNEAKAAAISALDTFIMLNLSANPEWTKEDEVKVGFGDSEGAYRFRPVPSTHAIGVYTPYGPGRLLVKFSDEGNGHIAIAEDSDSVDVHIVFTGENGAVTTFSDNYSTARATVILPPNCCNKRGMAKARWRNNNPEKGPWSDSVPVFCLLMDDLGKETVEAGPDSDR
ncbi:hypothetical protein FACS1894137_06080 [Spirochaetia bacterium]|nr:hypothetical protein FACS1894137_06080 [Spirochaetia bacterium]